MRDLIIYDLSIIKTKNTIIQYKLNIISGITYIKKLETIINCKKRMTDILFFIFLIKNNIFSNHKNIII